MLLSCPWMTQSGLGLGLGGGELLLLDPPRMTKFGV